MAPCHLAKQKDPDTHSNWSQQEANSVPILPQSASRHDAGGRNPHSNHLCRSTVRFGSKNRLQRSRKRGPRDAGALRVSFSLILGLDRLWELTPFLSGAKIRQPSLFVAGEVDGVITMYRQAFDSLEETMPGLRNKVLVPGAGHWIQQERPKEVNDLLIEFLASL